VKNKNYENIRCRTEQREREGGLLHCDTQMFVFSFYTLQLPTIFLLRAKMNDWTFPPTPPSSSTMDKQEIAGDSGPLKKFPALTHCDRLGIMFRFYTLQVLISFLLSLERNEWPSPVPPPCRSAVDKQDIFGDPVPKKPLPALKSTTRMWFVLTNQSSNVSTLSPQIVNPVKQSG
jgi:hypothetical protein